MFSYKTQKPIPPTHPNKTTTRPIINQRETNKPIPNQPQNCINVY